MPPKGQIHYYKWSKVPPNYSHSSPLHIKVVYKFFGSNYLNLIMLEGQWSEVVGKRSRGLFLKGPKSLLGVSGVQLRSKFFYQIIKYGTSFNSIFRYEVHI